MAARRGKVVKSIDEARAVLKEIVGARGTIQLKQHLFEQYEPGGRYESVEWHGSVKLESPGELSVSTGLIRANTPADLVRKLAQALRIAIDKRAESLRPRRLETRVDARPPQRKVIEATAVRRLEHQPAGN